MREPWLRSPTDIPSGFREEGFVVRPLTIHDVVKDYDAVMSSRRTLRGLFGPGSGWPEEDLSLEQDLIDIAWHQKEFELRSTFAYTIVDAEESRSLGCVYLFPSRHPSHEAEAFYWVRDSIANTPLGRLIDRSVRRWISTEWPFRRIAFPGRDVSWEEWTTS
ncbi:MAG: GNAT family N-acetyltransferase [Betaproteobacteria bacterium]|nr:GNAT family N-acetyltransferase [Betaproteobacteria bacterium]